jgi:hypothetical protein
MNRLALMGLAVIALSAQADVVVTQSNPYQVNLQGLTSSAATDTSWTAGSNGKMVLSAFAPAAGASAYVQIANGSSDKFTFGQFGTASIFVNHSWLFSTPNDGARLAYSRTGLDGDWTYADVTGTNGYNGNPAAWGGAAWTGVQNTAVTSSFSFNVTDANPYYLRLEAKFNGIADYQGDPVWSINATTVTVPEPGTLLLGGIAAVVGGSGVFWRCRRKKVSSQDQTGTVNPTAAV